MTDIELKIWLNQEIAETDKNISELNEYKQYLLEERANIEWKLYINQVILKAVR